MPKSKRSAAIEEESNKKMKLKNSCKMTLSDTRDVKLSRESCKFIDHTTNTTTEISIQKFVKILEHIDEIDKQINRIRNDLNGHCFIHIGGKWYLSMGEKYRCVNIRRWFVNEKNVKTATREGISLRFGEWYKFKQNLESMSRELPDVFATKPCYLTHASDDYCHECKELND